jgi:hypothetical protein
MKKNGSKIKERRDFVAKADFLTEITEDARTGKVTGPIRIDLRRPKKPAKGRKSKRP